MHFVGFRLSYIFPQCQPLHYGYTPGNVYLFTEPVRGQENISFCSILVLSYYLRCQHSTFGKCKQSISANGQVSTLCYANCIPVVTWIRPTSERDLGPSHRCLVTCMNFSLSQQLMDMSDLQYLSLFCSANAYGVFG